MTAGELPRDSRRRQLTSVAAVPGSGPAGVTTGPLAQRIFDAMPVAVLAVDIGRRPLLLNGRCRVILTERDGLLLDNGRLVSSSLEADGNLQRALATVFASAGDPVGCRVLIPRLAGRPPLRLEVAPLLGNFGAGAQAVACAMVLIHEAPAAGPGWADAIATAYGLTPAEMRVAELLVAGRGADVIATTVGVAESTVRTHVKHLFAKTGVRRQHELVALLLGPRVT